MIRGLALNELGTEMTLSNREADVEAEQRWAYRLRQIDSLADV